MASTLGKRQLVATLLPKKKEKEKKGPMGRAFTKQSMKAGVSPQPDDLRKLRIYMGGDFTTAWKRKVKKFEKKYRKRGGKA